MNITVYNTFILEYFCSAVLKRSTHLQLSVVAIGVYYRSAQFLQIYLIVIS